MYNYFSKIILLISFVIAFYRCDLLTTREAEEPERSRSSYIIPTTPEQLFTNLRNSFSEKITNDYLNSFVDSSFSDIAFSFTASSQAIFKYGVLSVWDLESEEKYFNNLINAIGNKGNIILSLNLLETSIDGNSQSRSYNYAIKIPLIDESTPQLFEGIALFKVVLDDNNQWVIAEWSDIENGDSPTWSELKGRFYIF
ncbi:MAG: hypothetical protein OQJ81_04145 [Melioribacteraceae bacterium]|nr:hypothetical protein [Melioribacteraceae bacterium]